MPNLYRFTLGLGFAALSQTLPLTKATVKAQMVESTAASLTNACPPPALSRLTRHQVAAGETLESIARRYNLLPTTLMGLNPSVQNGQVAVGTTLLVPPFNGVRVELEPNQTWRQIAKHYRVRPDVLFEVNGCQTNPRVVFVPGVNWSPLTGTSTPASIASLATQLLTGAPLPTASPPGAVLLPYGWKILPLTGKVGFHSGIDLAAPVGTAVAAMADGTIAFAGQQGDYGNLVVINHAEGLQTRYAQLATVTVQTGQTVRRGQTIGTVGVSGRPSSKASHLHLEVRSRSQMGWVAENPALVLQPAQQSRRTP
ncbi:MAG TPA: M23 family metallopeptidase [Coleofasciculaceae cyanobacterium]